MTRCQRSRRAFFEAELRAHWEMDRHGKTKAYRAAEAASERAHERGRGCSWQRPRSTRLAGLGLPPLPRHGHYPKGAKLAAACRELHRAHQAAGGATGMRAYGIKDRAVALGCRWAFGRR